MKRLLALAVAGAAFAAAPAEARMAKSVPFSTSSALGLEGENGTDEAWEPALQPTGLVDWIKDLTRTKPRPGKPVKNDITATLEAMPHQPHPRSPARIRRISPCGATI